MSLWQLLIDGGKRLFDADTPEEPVQGEYGCAPDPNDVGFTAAVIGLSAKMAAADGRVSDAEVMMFSRIFRAAPEDAKQVRRVFRLAQQTVRGYEAYARKIARKYSARPCLLEGVLDRLARARGAARNGQRTERLHNVSAAM